MKNILKTLFCMPEGEQKIGKEKSITRRIFDLRLPRILAALCSVALSFLLFISVVGFIASLFSCNSRSLSNAMNNVQSLDSNKTKDLPALNDETLLFKSNPLTETNKNDLDPQTILQSLDEIADLERAGSWLQGMALTESSIREIAGDIPGAVAAAYKELALAYGRGLIQKEEKEKGILNLLELKNDQTNAAANAVLAFSRGEWEQAHKELSLLFCEEEEPDSFANWMLLVCALEKQTNGSKTGETGISEDRRASSAYRSIRARYAQFPEYWYRGARAFSGAVAADYAENCINSSPQGPFAQECRKILAEFTGLNGEDGLCIRTKREIEVCITQSINARNPQMLDSLLPLIELPDNLYTVYAVTALKSIVNIPGFREYFTSRADIFSGRTSERLSYIARS